MGYNATETPRLIDVITTPRASPGPMIHVPGVRRTPGHLCGGDTQGRNDPPPCPGHRTSHMDESRSRLGAAAAARSCGQLRTSQNSSATRIRNHTTHVHKMVTRERGGEKDRVVASARTPIAHRGVDREMAARCRVVVNGRGAAMNVWGGGGRQAVASGVVGRRCARVFGELA